MRFSTIKCFAFLTEQFFRRLSAEKIGEFNASGLIFKDSVQVWPNNSSNHMNA